jgi:hypothetical protein
MSLVPLVLKCPYTTAAILILICLLGFRAATRMPVDIFPENRYPGGQCRLELQRHECNRHSKSDLVVS